MYYFKNMELLNGLNRQQKEAVCHIEGPSLVVAGAGTGKTKVIIHRIANLLKRNINPRCILAVTFTNKAAQEMKERLAILAGNIPVLGITVGTFHAISADILRKYGNRIGISPHFSILDEKQSFEIIKSSIEELNLDLRQFQPSTIQNFISRKKSHINEKADEDFFPDTLKAIQEKYDECLKKQNALDFDDLIQKTVFLFEKKPEILKIYREKWPYIHIDEYQDTNDIQYRLIYLLAQSQNNICAVGDDDQSIYGFRGADFRNILNFEKTWPDAKIVTLERNYRSSQKILDAANAVIEKNTMRRKKNLFTKENAGRKLTAFESKDEKEEANFAAQKIKQLLQKGLSSIAVLCRTNFQFRPFEEAFINHSIPYQAAATQDSLSTGDPCPVRLMTVHAAKGLEFENVFIPGLEKGLFPHFGGEKEEERRLFYVALTRAQKKVFLSFCRYRTALGAKQINQPSQFLSDIPKSLLKWL